MRLRAQSWPPHAAGRQRRWSPSCRHVSRSAVFRRLLHPSQRITHLARLGSRLRSIVCRRPPNAPLPPSDVRSARPIDARGWETTRRQTSANCPSRDRAQRPAWFSSFPRAEVSSISLGDVRYVRPDLCGQRRREACDVRVGGANRRCAALGCQPDLGGPTVSIGSPSDATQRLAIVCTRAVSTRNCWRIALQCNSAVALPLSLFRRTLSG